MMHVPRGARAALVGLLAGALVSPGAIVLSARPALAADDAQAPPADNRARAQELFDSALADAEAGDLASACPKFLASQEADPKASTLLNLASCYEKNGQTASAWGAFREAEGLARKVDRSDWEATARTHAETLEPKLVKLTVDVPASSRVPGLVVTRDGARLATGEWGVAIPVDPGEHVVAASSAGYVSWESKTNVREASGTVAVPPLELLPVAPAPELPAAQPVTHEAPVAPRSWWTPMRTAGVAVAGAGAVALVTGGVLGLIAKGNYDDAHGRCTDGARGCPSGAVSDSNAAYGMATGATVVFVVGAVAAASGVALVLLSPSPMTTRSASLRASLQVGPGSVGVLGRW